MNKITYFASRGLTLAAIATFLGYPEITSMTSLTNQTVSSQDVPLPSTLVANQSVEIAVDSFRWLERQESSGKKDHHHNNSLENDNLVTVPQTKNIQDRAVQLESSLAKTVTLVKELEGFRSYAYIDTDGTTVIGYGMPVINGRKVQLGDRISQVQAETALKGKLQEIQQQILAVSTVQLNYNQIVALNSFAFNVGVEPLLNSTLFRKLNAKDFLGAANEFPRWNKAHMGGRLVTMTGLTRRRLAERNLFLTAVN